MDISTFIKSLDNNDSVIIYGAGKMGQQVAACLKHLPKPVYPKCFSVSSGEEGTIDGIMVKRIGSIDNITTSLVILATSRIYHNDIVDTLQRIGVNNVFIMDNEMLDVLKREALSTMLRQMGIDVTLLKAVTNDLYSSLSMFQDETYNVSIRRAMRDIAGAQSAAMGSGKGEGGQALREIFLHPSGQLGCAGRLSRHHCFESSFGAGAIGAIEDAADGLGDLGALIQARNISLGVFLEMGNS